jgi:hypothetical protein
MEDAGHIQAAHIAERQSILKSRDIVEELGDYLGTDGRCAAATNVVEQAHQALSSPLAMQPSLPPALDQTQHILLDLNPIATEMTIFRRRSQVELL